MTIRLQNSLHYGDIIIQDGVIVALGDDTRQSQILIDQSIDCTGAYIWPGLIDSHVHFRVPGEEYKEDWLTGSAAALAGGVTSVVDMPSNIPPILTAQALVHKNQMIARQTAIDYKLIIGVSDDTIVEAVHTPAAGIKVYLTPHSTGMGIRTNAALEELFQKTNTLLLIHAEDNALVQQHRQQSKRPQPADHSIIRDPMTAIRAVTKIIALVQRYHKPTYICHVSTAAEVSLIRQAKLAGLPIYAEVTPHHLFLNESDYERLGMLAKVNPPLRTVADNAALLAGISDGTIDTIATDHAPHLVSEKQLPYDQAAAGYPSIEFLLPLLLTLVHEQKITLADIERCCITNPAKLFGFHKAITLNHYADIVVFDPTAQWKIEVPHIKSKAQWSPYLGKTVFGRILYIQSAAPKIQSKTV